MAIPFSDKLTRHETKATALDQHILKLSKINGVFLECEYKRMMSVFGKKKLKTAQPRGSELEANWN